MVQDFDPAQAQRLVTIAANSYVVAPGIRLRLRPYGTDLAETGVISGTPAMVLGRIVARRTTSSSTT